MQALFLVDGHLTRIEGREAVLRACRERHVKDTRDVVWLILSARDAAVEEMLQALFGIHPLVVEDIWSRRQLPKVVDYGDYLQVVAHGLALEDDEHVSLELDIIMGSSFVVTHAHGPCSQLDDLRATRLLARGPAWITHTLLDLMVDDCVPFIDGMDGRIAGLEAEVVAHAGKPGGDTLVPKIFALKRQLQVLRRAGVHQREVLLRLGRGDFGQIPSEATPYFRDVYEHFVRVADLAETHREQLSNLLDAYWSVQSHRMNEIMKTLTLMSTIMLPLTFIAGVYGMNFSHMPELSWRYGYPAALALMLAVAGSIFAWFKHRKWF